MVFIGRINTSGRSGCKIKALPQVTLASTYGPPKDLRHSPAQDRVNNKSQRRRSARQKRQSPFCARLRTSACNAVSPEHGLAVNRCCRLPIVRSHFWNQRFTVCMVRYASRQPKCLAVSTRSGVTTSKDAGVRFYTYTSTLAWPCRGAKQTTAICSYSIGRTDGGREVDRTDARPGTGVVCSLSSNAHPPRHEPAASLAFMFQQELKLDLDLAVVRMDGWRRDSLFDATGPLGSTRRQICEA